jgi:hypothetical protein
MMVLTPGVRENDLITAMRGAPITVIRVTVFSFASYPVKIKDKVTTKAVSGIYRKRIKPSVISSTQQRPHTDNPAPKLIKLNCTLYHSTLFWHFPAKELKMTEYFTLCATFQLFLLQTKKIIEKSHGYNTHQQGDKQILELNCNNNCRYKRPDIDVLYTDIDLPLGSKNT